MCIISTSPAYNISVAALLVRSATGLYLVFTQMRASLYEITGTLTYGAQLAMKTEHKDD